MNRQVIVSLLLVLGLAIAVSGQGCKSLDDFQKDIANQPLGSLGASEMGGNGNGAGYGGMTHVGQYYNLADSDDCVLINPGETETSFIDSFLDVRQDGTVIYYDSCNEENGVEVDIEDLDTAALAEGIIRFKEEFFEKYDEPPHLGPYSRIVEMKSVLQFLNQVANGNGDTLISMNLVFREPRDNPEELWLEIGYVKSTRNARGNRFLDRGQIEAVLLIKTIEQGKSIYTSRALSSLSLVVDPLGGETRDLFRKNVKIGLEIDGIQVEAEMTNLRLD